ncbi:radical SAM protein [Acrocarpospora sp. B8E8]|uniref:radical SAM protein n=1 Tax=Acrocarpospora sp. B8E8 TaxID=3153572 RepID=UPI00325DCCDE
MVIRDGYVIVQYQPTLAPTVLDQLRAYVTDHRSAHLAGLRDPLRSGMLMRVMYKVRLSEAGVHLFDRLSGLNVLLDEVKVPAEQVSRAPRYLSVALTNACELRCRYCYAPKQAAALDLGRVVAWAVELDGAGCLGVGFGGGEPTAHPRFPQICAQIAESTSMAVTFTTHGHRLTSQLADALRGSVHFARLSVDGVAATYERLRRRPFAAVLAAAGLLRSVAPFGVNVVVNADTIGELDALAEFAADVEASELLLLPEQPTTATPGISDADAERLVQWIRAAKPQVRLSISRSGLEGSVPAVEVIPGEQPLDAHMHVDATGVLRPHAYASVGMPIKGSILDAVQALREAA